jgi:hypothetical protein
MEKNQLLFRFDYVDAQLDLLMDKYNVSDPYLCVIMVDMMRIYEIDIVQAVDMLVDGCEETKRLTREKEDTYYANKW